MGERFDGAAIVAELNSFRDGDASFDRALTAANPALTAEANLIARAQQYDADALSEIYESFYPRIYQYFYAQLSDAPLAEDFASDVMLQVVESIDRYHFRGTPLAAWVFRIARNRVVDHHRRRSRRPQIALEDSLPSQADGPYALVERSVEHASVRAAMGGLTEEQRQVIILKFVEELDNASVAEALGRSLGAVKSLQHRALVAMRKVLEQEGVGG